MARSAIKNVAVERRQAPNPRNYENDTTVTRLNRPANDNDEGTPSDRGVRNVERETWTDRVQRSKAEQRKDKPSSVKINTAPSRAGLRRRLPAPKKLASKIKQRVEMARDTMVSARVAVNLVTWTWWNIGLLQLIAGVLYLMGLMWLFMSEETIIDYIDFIDLATRGGEMLAYAGMVLSFICWFLLLLAGILVFTMRGVSILRPWSIPMMVACLIMHVVPALNLVPWMYLWYFYVVTSQIKVK